jgi:hypothetical protein
MRDRETRPNREEQMFGMWKVCGGLPVWGYRKRGWGLSCGPPFVRGLRGLSSGVPSGRSELETTAIRMGLCFAHSLRPPRARRTPSRGGEHWEARDGRKDAGESHSEGYGRKVAVCGWRTWDRLPSYRFPFRSQCQF